MNPGDIWCANCMTYHASLTVCPPKTKPAPVQSADKLVEIIRHGESIPCKGQDGYDAYGTRLISRGEAVALIEADRAAQRQAGREEGIESCGAMMRKIDERDAQIAALNARYAALEEAARDALPTWELLCMCAQCEQKQKAIRKALADLEGK